MEKEALYTYYISGKSFTDLCKGLTSATDLIVNMPPLVSYTKTPFVD